MIFKGGTALRIVHQGWRYSEDPDFNSTYRVTEAQRLWTAVATDLGRYGIAAESRETWQG
jgi:predicted nucleotidyltransferase component of viral defense system